MIPKRLVKQMARQPDPLSEIVREGEHMAKQRRVRNTQKDLDDLRSSVRRLVGDNGLLDRAQSLLGTADLVMDGWDKARSWNNDYEEFKGKFMAEHPELSALIDGKDSKQEKL